MKEYVKLDVENGIGTIEFFHPQSNSLPGHILAELANTIIPNTEFPGALAVGVPLEIETYVFNVYEEENISKFRDGLKKLNDFLNNNSSKFPKPFYESNLLKKLGLISNFSVVIVIKN